MRLEKRHHFLLELPGRHLKLVYTFPFVLRGDVSSVENDCIQCEPTLQVVCLGTDIRCAEIKREKIGISS